MKTSLTKKRQVAVKERVRKSEKLKTLNSLRAKFAWIKDQILYIETKPFPTKEETEWLKWARPRLKELHQPNVTTITKIDLSRFL